MLATMYKGEDSHAPARREYFPPPHPPPARRLSRSYRPEQSGCLPIFAHRDPTRPGDRSAKAVRLRQAEHTSELQSQMRTSFAVFCSENKHKLQRSLENAHT